MAIIEPVLEGAVHRDDSVEAADKVGKNLGVAAPLHGALQPHHTAVDRNPNVNRVDEKPSRNDALDDVGSDVIVAPAETRKQIASRDYSHHPVVGAEHD